jgi:hypothetical protein
VSGEASETVRELSRPRQKKLALADRRTKTAGLRARDPADEYEVKGGATYWLRPDRETGEPVPVMLATFSAEIVAEDLLDDGAETALTWLLAVSGMDGRKGEIRVTPERLGQPARWGPMAIGTSALVRPGAGSSDRMREAVQARSKNVDRRHIYTHTGWRKPGSRPAYLSASGAIGADGLDSGVTVDLGGMAGYSLPEPPSRRELAGAVRASLSLLDISRRDALTVPLLGSVYRASLPLPAECSAWMVGETGSFKTALSVVALQHFGSGLDDSHIPGHWTSTVNALEAQAHKLDGALFVIDDYSPAVNQTEARKREHLVETLLRGAANHGGRSRLRPDGREWAARPPRAQILTSAEDLPPANPSLRTRIMIVPVSRGDVNAQRLTAAQELGRAGILSQAMSGFIRWQAARWRTDYPDRLKAGQAELRTEAASEGHPRIALNIASLALGWNQWLGFAAECGAIDDDEHEALWQRAWKALCDLGADQNKYRQSASPAAVYLKALNALIHSGRAHLADTRNQAPEDAKQWGWTFGRDEITYYPSGDRLGWISGDEIWLHPATAYRAARRFAEESGAPLSVSEDALNEALHKAGKLARTGEGGRLTAKVRAGGTRPRALILTVSAFRSGGR